MMLASAVLARKEHFVIHHPSMVHLSVPALPDGLEMTAARTSMNAKKVGALPVNMEEHV